MATFQSPLVAKDGSQSSPEISSRELSILLSRLTQAILHPTQEDERRLRMSQFERARVETNLNFAQTALNKLEQASAGRPVGKRTDAFTDLVAQREVLELLLDRLEDYKKLAADYEDDGSSEEDLLGEIIPTPSESQDSRRSSNVGKEEEGPEDGEHIAQTMTKPESTAEPPAPTRSTDVPSPPPTSITTMEGDATQTSHNLRARGSNASPPSSTTAHSTARAMLFANRKNQSSQYYTSTATTATTTTATTEAILDQQRIEQDAILDSIRKMAGSLKQSSQNFSASLESDKDKLGAAGSSMEKSELSMEAAKGRMGSLQRMTEGEGWWGRMMLYAWVYGLMVVLVLVVFVFPKLRL